MMTDSKRIHPHKFTLWVAMASIVMMFAGLTSALIVKRGQSSWQGYELPLIFTYSTIVIVVSSVTMQLAVKKFKDREMLQYRWMLVATAILGMAFMAMQFVGFNALQEKGIKLIGRGSNVSGSFLAVIAGVHMLHVVGGVVALGVMLGRVFSSRKRMYSSVPVEVLATYWHFVDVLWIYLFVFLKWVM